MTENKYVEMICDLNEQPWDEIALPGDYKIGSLKEAQEDELYRCYYAAFKAGDARFFFEQNEMGRREYFDMLCLDEARNEPGSSIIRKNGKIAGFTYVLPYGDGNRHISCMCVHPDDQRRGLGAFMLRHAIKEVAAQGSKSITLGTDTRMAAFRLYCQYGFKIMEEQE